MVNLDVIKDNFLILSPSCYLKLQILGVVTLQEKGIF